MRESSSDPSAGKFAIIGERHERRSAVAIVGKVGSPYVIGKSLFKENCVNLRGVQRRLNFREQSSGLRKKKNDKSAHAARTNDYVSSAANGETHGRYRFRKVREVCPTFSPLNYKTPRFKVTRKLGSARIRTSHSPRFSVRSARNGDN